MCRASKTDGNQSHRRRHYPNADLSVRSLLVLAYDWMVKTSLIAVCLMLSCATGQPNGGAGDAEWQEADIPICNAATEGRIIQAALGTSRPEVPFLGRVVTRLADGSLVPLKNVRF